VYRKLKRMNEDEDEEGKDVVENTNIYTLNIQDPSFHSLLVRSAYSRTQPGRPIV
jgi:hypothetical protein